MDIRVEIHEERKVELVRPEQSLERGHEASQLVAEQGPLVGRDVDHRRALPAEDEHRLAQEVLVPVDRKCPGRPLFDHALAEKAESHRDMIAWAHASPR
jgi:hypothetical protein